MFYSFFKEITNNSLFLHYLLTFILKTFKINEKKFPVGKNIQREGDYKSSYRVNYYGTHQLFEVFLSNKKFQSDKS